MKYFKYLLIIPLVCFFACADELEDVNEDLNNPTDVPVNRLIMGIERDLSSEYAVSSYDLTNKMLNYTEYPLKQWDHFLLIRDANEDWWEQHYDELANVDYIINKAKTGEENVKGVGLVLKSWMYYITSSLYGDLPYSEAGQADKGNNQPEYDTQEVIFNGILSDLDQANQLLGTGAFALQGDFLLGNDIQKWKKFANSLKVRVLMAMSNQINSKVELQKMINDPVTYPLMESNSDQPAFTYNQEVYYPRNRDGLFFVNDVYMCKDFIDSLLELGDERIKMYAAKAERPVNGDYVGVPSGTTKNPSGDVSKTSDLIFDSRTNFALQTVWMSYAELQFLLAEAAEKGWIDGGTSKAQQYYEKGIEASYNYQKERLDIGIDQGANLDAMSIWEPAYLKQEGVEYVGTQNEKLGLIATQKWLALYLDMESYFSWRRTKLPVLTFDASTTNNGVPPNRLRYPVDERIYNKKNYEAAIARQGADDWNTLMWLIK
ncbi:SusD/RagB family nutrient-binding outer membrane lipoprotein [Carboxylicivirga taeanensis]|uniref:SusD/RagB family nutrient-binding outer membrane lipoprotein n=1 Tax=Carboxylicivirga taeanensis TaxID=1416875 RepID=UPI003F6E3AA5